MLTAHRVIYSLKICYVPIDQEKSHPCLESGRPSGHTTYAHINYLLEAGPDRQLPRYSWIFMSTCFHQESTASTRQGESFVLEGRFTFCFFTFLKYYFSFSLCFPLVPTVLESYGGCFRCLQKSGMTSELYSGRYWGLQGSWSITRTYTPKRQNIHRN